VTWAACVAAGYSPVWSTTAVNSALDVFDSTFSAHPNSSRSTRVTSFYNLIQNNTKARLIIKEMIYVDNIISEHWTQVWQMDGVSVAMVRVLLKNRKRRRFIVSPEV